MQACHILQREYSPLPTRNISYLSYDLWILLCLVPIKAYVKGNKKGTAFSHFCWDVALTWSKTFLIPPVILAWADLFSHVVLILYLKHMPLQILIIVWKKYLLCWLWNHLLEQLFNSDFCTRWSLYYFCKHTTEKYAYQQSQQWRTCNTGEKLILLIGLNVSHESTLYRVEKLTKVVVYVLQM